MTYLSADTVLYEWPSDSGKFRYIWVFNNLGEHTYTVGTELGANGNSIYFVTFRYHYNEFYQLDTSQMDVVYFTSGIRSGKGQQITAHEWVDSNMISSRNVLHSTDVTYEYISGTNGFAYFNLPDIQAAYMYEMAVKPIVSRNLWSKATFENGTVQNAFYTFDSRGRATKQVILLGLDTLVSRSVTYRCR